MLRRKRKVAATRWQTPDPLDSGCRKALKLPRKPSQQLLSPRVMTWSSGRDWRLFWYAEGCLGRLQCGLRVIALTETGLSFNQDLATGKPCNPGKLLTLLGPRFLI
jgi:hypothetical protein